MPLGKKATVIMREIRLVWANKRYIASIMGSARWLVSRRYELKRPKSEMKPTIFGPGIAYSVALAILTFPIATFIIGSIMLGVGWYNVGEYVGGEENLGSTMAELFKFPLRATLWLLQHVLDIPILHAHALSDPEDAVNVNATLATSEAEVAKAARSNSDADDRGVSGRPAKHGPDETWILVNGIVETKAMAEASADLIKDLTGRKVTVFYNPTQGFGMDIAECLLGRTLNTNSRPAERLADVVDGQLEMGRNVVLICHSQGSIIAANAMRTMCNRVKEEEDEKKKNALLERLERLELYSFAAAADEFCSVPTRDGESVAPFAEHFAAEWDMVARIGSLYFSGQLPPVNGAEIHPENWNGRVHLLKASNDGEKQPEDWQGHLVKEHLWPAVVAGELGQDSVFIKKYGVHREEKKKSM